MVATEEKEMEISIGDVILIPKGEKHRHGTKPGPPMTHIVILLAHQHIQQVEE